MFFSPKSSAQFLPTAYNTIAEDFSNTRQHAWKEFEALFADQNHDEYILDIGCGNGRVVEYLQSKNISFRYHGIDITENFLVIAQNKYHTFSHVTFARQGFLDPCPPRTYNRIIAVASFHHLASRDDRRIALQNIYTALVPGGIFAMTLWNWKEQEKYISQVREAYIRSLYNPFFGAHDGIIPFGTQKIPRYYYWFSYQEIRELLEETGFTNIAIDFSEGKKNYIVTAKKTTFFPLFYVHSIGFHMLSFDECMNLLEKWSSQKGLQKKIYTPNPEMIVAASSQIAFAEVLKRADLSLPDGNGILWAYGMKSSEDKFIFWKWGIGLVKILQYAFLRKTYPKPIEVPICGSDVFRAFLEKKVGRIFLLGGSKGSAEYIQSLYPHTIVGIENRMMHEVSDKEIIEKIHQSQATVLFVALGAPRQEYWIDKNIHFLPHISFAMGVGGSFDFVSGIQKRAPIFFQKAGIEWLYRLYMDPSRWKRIWNATGKFIALTIRNR